MTTIYLARHCDVDNPAGIIYGHRAGTRLSALGRSQARIQGAYLAARGIERIIASPLERAIETAAAIRHACGLAGIETDDRLTEAHFGRHLQGVKRWQIPVRRPLWWVHLLAPGALPGDEGVQAMARRMRGVLDEVAADGRKTVLVSHGDPIQAFWITVERRNPYALHLLSCKKGGMLAIRGYPEEPAVTYLSPSALRAATSTGGPSPASSGG